MNPHPACRVVFDTNVVLSALLFSAGRLAWLRGHWREGGCVPLISPATARELTRVLGYPKFRLSREYCTELLAKYVPYCESLDPANKCPIACRDAKDQPLLELAGQTAFLIETPETYRRRIIGLGEHP